MLIIPTLISTLQFPLSHVFIPNFLPLSQILNISNKNKSHWAKTAINGRWATSRKTNSCNFATIPVDIWNGGLLSWWNRTGFVSQSGESFSLLGFLQTALSHCFIPDRYCIAVRQVIDKDYSSAVPRKQWSSPSQPSKWYSLLCSAFKWWNHASSTVTNQRKTPVDCV